jgi:hypothetical protein
MSKLNLLSLQLQIPSSLHLGYHLNISLLQSKHFFSLLYLVKGPLCEVEPLFLHMAEDSHISAEETSGLLSRPHVVAYSLNNQKEPMGCV